jgi:pimeloyl-ACP methyl ester carboxylesterase
MAKLTREGCSLDYELIDIAAPWVTPRETVVLHHGVGASRELWAEWLPALVDRYRVLRFDMRGHGASTWAERASALTLDELTDDLFAVMDAAGVVQAHLVGESIGGTIALNAALRVAERVHTLTVSNGAHLGASIQAVADWRAIIEVRGMAGWSAHLMPRRFFMDDIPAAVANWFEALQASAHPEAVLQMLAALVGADTTDRLPGLRPPLMLLHPDSSPFIPLPVICDFMARVSDARLHVIGRARHGMPLSHARTCAALLRDFLGGRGKPRCRPPCSDGTRLYIKGRPDKLDGLIGDT